MKSFDVNGMWLCRLELVLTLESERPQHLSRPSLCILLIVGHCAPTSLKCFCGSTKLKDELEIQAKPLSCSLMVGPQQRLDFSFSEHPGKKPCSLPPNTSYPPFLLKPSTEQRSGFLKPDVVANKSGVKPALGIAFLATIGFLKKQIQSHVHLDQSC